MKAFELEIRKNMFENKSDLEKYMDDLFIPLENAFIRSHTRIHIANTSAGASDDVSGIEGFSRILWGLVAHDHRGPQDSLWIKMRQGIIHGTNPEHKDYFGKALDYDQRIVEMAAIGYAFVLKPECIYEPLSKLEKTNLYKWLDQINHVEAYNCNWKFFRVMVNIGFKSLGLDYNKEQMEAYLDDMDSYYIGNGWYTDGIQTEAHVDYYVPFAMHYYGLFYSMYMKDVDPKRAEIYEQRAILFASEFVYWFGKDGSALPYGRSLTYRYAQSAFWSILATSGLKTEFSLGQIKGIIMRNFRWWNSKPIYDRGGYLTIGYAYPNLFMGEDYNAPGSVYWCLKSMIVCSLPDDHEFWKVKEAPLPLLKETKIIEPARLLIKRGIKSEQFIAYNGGNYHTNGHIHVECKYEKFAYSSLFGFSVPRSHKNLNFGAYDSTLAVSKDGYYYRHKDKSSYVSIKEDVIHTSWQPFEDVVIDTYLVAAFPWHIRLHKITSKDTLYTADGGFAFGLGEIDDQKFTQVAACLTANGIAESRDSYSGIVDLSDNQSFEMIRAASNTNIMNPRTVIPTLKAKLKPGRHWIASMVFGDGKSYEPIEVPEIIVGDKEVIVKHINSKKVFLISL